VYLPYEVFATAKISSPVFLVAISRVIVVWWLQ